MEMRARFRAFEPGGTGMGLANLGRDMIASALLGDGSYPLLNNANAYIGVGDSSTAFSAAQTDLQAATNKLRKAMDATYPQRAANVLTLRATFGTTDANYAWNEWGVFNASSSGTMFNRVVNSLGTKTASATWQLTVTLTFS